MNGLEYEDTAAGFNEMLAARGSVTRSTVEWQDVPAWSVAIGLREPLRDTVPRSVKNADTTWKKILIPWARGLSIVPVKKQQSRKLFLWGVLIAIGLFLLYAFWQREQDDPIYKGKRLSEWLEEDVKSGRQRDPIIVGGLPGPYLKESEEAVQAFGERAIPKLLQMLQAKDSLLKTKFAELARKQNFVEFEFTWAETYRMQALHGFQILGPRAKGALPELSRLYFQTNLVWPLWGLIAIGPDSLPIYRSGLTNQDENIRSTSAYQFCGYSPNEVASDVPSLLVCLKDPSSRVRSSAMVSLGFIGQNGDVVIPALIERLQDSDHTIRFFAISAIGRFGPQATSAVPAIIQTMNEAISNKFIHDWLGPGLILTNGTNALQKIEGKFVE